MTMEPFCSRVSVPLLCRGSAKSAIPGPVISRGIEKSDSPPRHRGTEEKNWRAKRAEKKQDNQDAAPPDDAMNLSVSVSRWFTLGTWALAHCPGNF